MNKANLEDDEFVSVNVLVPKHLVGVVYRAVADIVEGRFPSSSTLSTSLDDRFQKWHRDQIVQLKKEVRNPTALSLLNLTAKRAGEWISYDEVYREAGRTARQAQGDLAGFTQLIKRLFKQNAEGWWPVEVQLGKPIKYRMPPEIAQYWKETESS